MDSNTELSLCYFKYHPLIKKTIKSSSHRKKNTNFAFLQRDINPKYDLQHLSKTLFFSPQSTEYFPMPFSSFI